MKVRSALTPWALALSLLIHALLTGTMLDSLSVAPAPPKEAKEPETLIAELISPPPPPRREIAPPSLAKEVEKPRVDARPGERNTEAEKEMLRRGQEEKAELLPPGPKTPPIPPTPPVRSTEKKAEERKGTPEKQERQAKAATGEKTPAKGERPAPSAAKRDDMPKKVNPILRLGQNELLAKLSEEPDDKGEEKEATNEAKTPASTAANDRQRELKLRSVEPFHKNFALTGPQPGVSDVLQNVPDGEITMLNEKADIFAVFVRRVALQVFGALRRSSWTSLPYSEVFGVGRFARIRAVLSPQGRLLRVEPLDGSGSFLFDDLFRAAVEHGANDQNPPAEAKAPDGNYRFIFLARTWARRKPDGPEQRWLELGTGLE